MKTITVLGNEYSIIEQKNERDKVEFKEDQLLIEYEDKSPESLLDDFLSDLLFNKVSDITDSFKKEGKIDLLGTLDVEITEKIDNKKTRIAKLKGNKIILKQDLVELPEDVIKYVIAHEIAHVSNKGHTKRFWKTVELIFPKYEEAKQELASNSNLIQGFV